ncbi:CopG family transcriptional regulator [bacterium CPR1]|nr:CopG family transcriptional regulator [bacterium CPR1]
MGEKRNVTLSMPAGLIRSAKRLAVDQGTSLSGLMIEALEQLVARGAGYEEAMEEELKLMDEGLDLGTRGRISWSRDELHER